MATTEKYLQQLQTDKSNLIAKYNEKGLMLGNSATFTDIVNEFDNLPSGGGASINGKTEQKTVASGSVAKGDFLTSPETTKNIELENLDYFTRSISSITDLENMFDDDINTYATLKSSSSSTHYIKFKGPSYEQLGLKKYTLIVGYSVSATVSATTNSSSNYVNLYGRRWKEFNAASESSSQYYYTGNTSTPQSTTVKTLTIDADHMLYGKDLWQFGFDIAQYATEFRIYNLSMSIRYLDNDKVKTITAETGALVGIANSSGVEGDTIDVYVPDVVA